jgi:hypothetical protein
MQERCLTPFLLVLAVALCGCESTQQKSAQLAKQPRSVAQERGVVVKRANPAVRVLRTAVVRDRYGTAVAVQLRLRGRHPQAQLPIAFDVAGAGGKPLYTNDLPGLAASLTHVALLRPGRSVWWVNDQVQADGARRAKARVGAASVKASATALARAPRLEPAALRLDEDSSGSFTRGVLRNRSKIEQRNVTVFAIAERGNRVVAAGRAGIERLKARGKASFKVFWIGDPKGARLRVFAPPTTLTEEEGG